MNIYFCAPYYFCRLKSCNPHSTLQCYVMKYKHTAKTDIVWRDSCLGLGNTTIVAPGYLCPSTHVADLPSRRSLHSVDTIRLVVPTSRLSTVGSRAFPVAGLQTWNDLPEDVTSAESLATFPRLLKTHLFRMSFPDYLLDINWLSPVDLAAVPLHRPRKTSFKLIDWLVGCFYIAVDRW